jgi:hypothetical protein
MFRRTLLCDGRPQNWVRFPIGFVGINGEFRSVLCFIELHAPSKKPQFCNTSSLLLIHIFYSHLETTGTLSFVQITEEVWFIWFVCTLTLNPLTWKIWWSPNNASRWQMGFNSAFKGLILSSQCTYSYRGRDISIYEYIQVHIRKYTHISQGLWHLKIFRFTFKTLCAYGIDYDVLRLASTSLQLL